MAFTAGFSVNVGDPTKASDVDVLAANDDYLKNAIDTFIANDANNRVLTATGSGTANAESNLTFDGSTLTVSGTVSATTLSGNVTGGTISGTTATFTGGLTGTTATFSGLISGNGGAEIGSNTAKVKFYSDSTYSGIYNGSSLVSDESYYFGSGDHFWYSDGSLAMKIDNGDLAVGTDKLFIDVSASAVGIGTSSPSAKVDIPIPSYDASTTNGMIKFTNPVNSSHANIQGSYVSGEGSNLVIGTNAYTSTTGQWTRWSSSYGSAALLFRRSGDIYFVTNTNAGIPESRMILTSAGLVGIGTSSPSESLTNRGNVFIETNSTSADSGNGLFWQSTTSGWSTSSAHAAIYGRRTDASNGYLRFDTRRSGTTQEAMRLDASGNMGLGVTPANNSKMHIQNSGTSRYAIEVDASNGNNLFGVWEQPSGDGHLYLRNSAGTAIVRFAADTASSDHYIASGNLGLGTNSPTYKLVVSNGGAAGYEFNVNGVNSGVNTVVYNRSTSAYVDSAHFVNNYYIYSGQTPAERFRVESTGVCAFMTPNVNIRFNGTATSTVLTDNNGVEIHTGGFIWAARQAGSLYLSRAGSTGEIAAFRYDAVTQVGSISVTSTATAYNTSSDYRLKENLVPITGAVDRVNALQPRRFNFISDPDMTVDGFVAHEVSPVVPEAISGEKDAVDEDGNPEYQGIDQSKLVPLLTAAIQELTARIEALEAA